MEPVIYARFGFWIRFLRTASWYFRAPCIFSYWVGFRRGTGSGESSGRGDSPAEETSTSLLARAGEVFRGVKKSVENLLRLTAVGVEENRNDPPAPLPTGAIFPNCFAAVLRGFGGLSVAFIGPRMSKGVLMARTFLCGRLEGVIEGPRK